jgi:glycerol uptake facilitator protein
MFGEYYVRQAVSGFADIALAMGAESFGTFMLVLAILFLTERCNAGKPDDKLAPVMIGLSLTSLICLFAPITQAGFNPARDFGPRMVALIFGWGERSFPDATGGFFWIYMVAPVLGGALAGFFFVTVIEPLLSDRGKAVMASDGGEAEK